MPAWQGIAIWTLVRALGVPPNVRRLGLRKSPQVSVGGAGHNCHRAIVIRAIRDCFALRARLTADHTCHRIQLFVAKGDDGHTYIRLIWGNRSSEQGLIGSPQFITCSA